MQPYLAQAITAHALPEHFAASIARFYLPLAEAIATAQQSASGCLVLGINGSQGSGKSTLADFLRLILQHQHQLNTAVVSIDDFYLTRAERRALSAEVHPLLITRGVPGTHDLELANRTLDALLAADANSRVALPRFNKAEDDRADPAQWPVIRGPVDVVILEGWCVGIGAEPESALAPPLNALESQDDTDGHWRGFVNDALAGPYAALFARLDYLVMLAAPSFECVYEWRLLQEEKLRQSLADQPASQLMSAAQISRFIAHYERLTRHALATLPQQCDWLLPLAADHTITALEHPARWHQQQ